MGIAPFRGFPDATGFAGGFHLGLYLPKIRQGDILNNGIKLKEEGVAVNKIFALFISFLLLGCISTQSRTTTFLDYLPGDGEGPAHKPDEDNKKQKGILKYTQRQGYDLSLSRVWSGVIKLDEEDDCYKGVKASVTNPNKFFRFSFGVLKSPERTTDVGVGYIKQEHSFILSPSLTAPIFRYDLDVRFGHIVKLNINTEFRTGIGYEWDILYKHGLYDFQLLGTNVDDVYIPNNIESDSRLSQVSTLDINIEPLHLESSLVINRAYVRWSFGVGVIW